MVNIENMYAAVSGADAGSWSGATKKEFLIIALTCAEECHNGQRNCPIFIKPHKFTCSTFALVQYHFHYIVSSFFCQTSDPL